MADGAFVSPLAPALPVAMPALAGVRLGVAHCGLRKASRHDLMVALLDEGSMIAGVFTRSKAPGAPIVWCREILGGGKVRGIVVNAGNANVFTGAAGRKAVEDTVDAIAGRLGCERRQIYVSSTGVIGQFLPAEKIVDVLPDAIEHASAAGWAEAAAAIMTTDTFPKLATRTATIDGVEVTLNGFCKGSGMIAPDMATMLGYVFTDAALPAPVLQALLVSGVERSFHCITVDGDTSTSDTVLLAATGKAKHAEIVDPADPRLKGFRRALDSLLLDLALQVARDGEGAEKLVEIRVTRAASRRAARVIGMTIANSPLVKTAIAAGDANWGRIVMAVGRAGEKADRDSLRVSIGGTLIAAAGTLVDGYDETPVARHMAGREILIEVDLGIGRGKATVWTCDLTHRYIDINGSYRS